MGGSGGGSDFSINGMKLTFVLIIIVEKLFIIYARNYTSTTVVRFLGSRLFVLMLQ